MRYLETAADTVSTPRFFNFAYYMPYYLQAKKSTKPAWGGAEAKLPSLPVSTRLTLYFSSGTKSPFKTASRRLSSRAK